MPDLADGSQWRVPTLEELSADIGLDLSLLDGEANDDVPASAPVAPSAPVVEQPAPEPALEIEPVPAPAAESATAVTPEPATEIASRLEPVPEPVAEPEPEPESKPAAEAESAPVLPSAPQRATVTPLSDGYDPLTAPAASVPGLMDELRAAGLEHLTEPIVDNSLESTDSAMVQSLTNVSDGLSHAPSAVELGHANHMNSEQLGGSAQSAGEPQYGTSSDQARRQSTSVAPAAEPPAPELQVIHHKIPDSPAPLPEAAQAQVQQVEPAMPAAPSHEFTASLGLGSPSQPTASPDAPRVSAAAPYVPTVQSTQPAPPMPAGQPGPSTAPGLQAPQEGEWQFAPEVTEGPEASGIASLRKSPLLLLGVAAAIVGLLALLYTSMRDSVVLSLDGASTPVSTFKNTVGEVLAENGITVGEHDLVAPEAMDAPVEDGMTITVLFGRPLTLVMGEETQEFWTTKATIGEALQELNLPLTEAQLGVPLSTPLSTDGLSLDVSQPMTLTLKLKGQSKDVSTLATTVQDFLAEQGITIGTQDTVSPSLDTALKEGMTISVVVVETKRVTETETIKHATERKTDSSLAAGQSKVVTEGADGQRETVFEITYRDGVEIERVEVESKVTKEAVTEVVAVGPWTGGSGIKPETQALNWYALARCESTNNPKAVNPAGPYYGLYQFSLPTWKSVGGSGLPINASSDEQTYRAQLLYQKAGAGQWPVCGKKLFS